MRPRWATPERTRRICPRSFLSFPSARSASDIAGNERDRRQLRRRRAHRNVQSAGRWLASALLALREPYPVGEGKQPGADPGRSGPHRVAVDLADPGEGMSATFVLLPANRTQRAEPLSPSSVRPMKAMRPLHEEPSPAVFGQGRGESGSGVGRSRSLSSGCPCSHVKYVRTTRSASLPGRRGRGRTARQRHQTISAAVTTPKLLLLPRIARTGRGRRATPGAPRHGR